jgi:hypothetical protein
MEFRNGEYEGKPHRLSSGTAGVEKGGQARSTAPSKETKPTPFVPKSHIRLPSCLLLPLRSKLSMLQSHSTIGTSAADAGVLRRAAEALQMQRAA